MTDKKLKLPEAGQWPDKLVVPALIAGAVLSTVGFLMAFFYVAPVGGAAVNGAELIGDVMVSQKMLLSQKIFYFHMPVAITSFIALGFGCYYAVRFLMTKNQRFDTCSRICLEIALLFVVLTMITGEMWTRFEWGVWWSWEPRLTTYLILMLIVIAYFVLRSSVDEPERRATFAAVVAIIATIDVPICFMITRLIPSSIHPVVLREGGMSPEMGMCVGLCALGMLLVGFVLYRTRFNQVRLTQRVEALKETLDDERSERAMNPILAAIYSTILPSAPYIIAAYALLWVALLVYVLMVFRGTKKATAQLTLLEEAVADQQAKARAAKDE